MSLDILHAIKEAIINLCPIIATISHGRRREDPFPTSAPITKMLISIALSGLIGATSGLIVVAFTSGQITQKLDDAIAKLDRLEQRVDNLTYGYKR